MERPPRSPLRDYVICARPLMGITDFCTVYPGSSYSVILSLLPSLRKVSLAQDELSTEKFLVLRTFLVMTRNCIFREWGWIWWKYWWWKWMNFGALSKQSMTHFKCFQVFWSWLNPSEFFPRLFPHILMTSSNMLK